MEKKQPGYWLVGATWGGRDDALPVFLMRGYWYCWDLNEVAAEDGGRGNSISVQQGRFREIRRGDRVAVKKMLGQGAKNMAILAVGTVKDVDLDEWRVYVDWVLDLREQERHVPLGGCTASIHGPYEAGDPWVHQVFCL
ncbi:MAG: glycyl-tRNA synthetase subunit alpha [Pseudomonadota bacterium]|nr:glycyl-tRNA synthetase subunit alpha [Pseudomonadota bacterium]